MLRAGAPSKASARRSSSGWICSAGDTPAIFTHQGAAGSAATTTPIALTGDRVAEASVHVVFFLASIRTTVTGATGAGVPSAVASYGWVGSSCAGGDGAGMLLAERGVVSTSAPWVHSPALLGAGAGSASFGSLRAAISERLPAGVPVKKFHTWLMVSPVWTKVSAGAEGESLDPPSPPGLAKSGPMRPFATAPATALKTAMRIAARARRDFRSRKWRLQSHQSAYRRSPTPRRADTTPHCPDLDPRSWDLMAR